MRLNGKLLAAVIAAFVSAGAWGQNNPYELNDECYELFSQADHLVEDTSTDEFEKVNQQLLEAANRTGDQKARTLYYVGKLKRICRMGLKAPSSEKAAWKGKLDAAREELKKVALETGYLQYYYYSYDLSQTYLYNTGQQLAAISLLNEMMADANQRGSDYGMMQARIFLAAIYKNQHDIMTARKFLKEAIDIHSESNDPLVSRQSITRACCDIADTYPVASDSARFYYNLAEKNAAIHIDSTRVEYYKTLMAAYDRDFKSYRKLRDNCLSDRSFPVLFKTGEPLLRCIDKLIDGQLDIKKNKSLLDTLNSTQQRVYLGSLASHYYVWDVSSYMMTLVYNSVTNTLAKNNSIRLDEVAAQYDNFTLNAALAKKSRQFTIITVVVALLTTIILLGALLFTWVHLRHLKKKNEDDGRHIRELQEANEKVRLADAAKTRFVQNMSHEVRTPLNAIVGFSQLLSLPDGSFPEEEKEEFAGHIVNNTKMLTMLLDDILNASSMDKGDYRISYEDGECGFMAQAAISSSEHRLQPGVTMSYVPGFEGEFHFTTDPRRVQQILINLLTNSCKHTSQGSITLACSVDKNKGEVVYSVTDTGTGIPADQAEKIFERFTKLNEFVQGTGLGLSICRDIASRMGGRVFLDTTYKDGGARFIFTLPVNPPETNNNQ